MFDRLPFQVTQAAARYESLTSLPVSVLLDNIRSTYNVGSFFRTADASGTGRLYLSGITASPPHSGISKTALGAEDRVAWERATDATALVAQLRDGGVEIAAIETSVHAIDLFDWKPRFPVCVVFGNELEGISASISAACDTHIRIPMLGMKHSLNVATAGGIVIYELLRKYRELQA
jgi:23S rRNA (guanosine2251-2'-O)-methyltransferase